jgi:hypothetical protein
MYKYGWNYGGQLTLFESCIRDSILLAESTSLIKNSFVNIGKLIRAWDKVWWPVVAKYSINNKEAEKKSLAAVRKFADYCKYDMTDDDHPTIAVDIPLELEINGTVVKTSLDLVKINRTEENSVQIIDFKRKGLSFVEVASDPGVLTSAYVVYFQERLRVKYTCVDLDEKKQKIHVSTAVFRDEDLQMARKLVRHTINGIKSNIFFKKPWLCKECNRCPSIE